MATKVDITSTLPAVNNIDIMVSDKLLRMQLANVRKSKHITQKQLSEASGLSESCISNIENGEQSSPTLRSLIRYANALGVELYIGFDNQKKNSLEEEES